MNHHPEAGLHDLFVAALEQPMAARFGFVETNVADPGLRHQLLELLARHDTLGWFLETDVRAFGPLPSIGPGARFGEFEILGYLAHGGRGVVFRARQRSLDREVALKVVPSVLSAGGAPLPRLRREAEFAARVEHPSLVPVYGAGECRERSVAWCAMRLVSGPTLMDVLDHLDERGVPPDADERRQLVGRALEIARALGALHAERLVHCDVKPSNIILEAGAPEPPWDTVAILVDFGLTQATDGTAASSIAGTPSYAAPERLRTGEVDPTADVFSLGMTLHDLLCGRTPEHRSEWAPEWSPALDGCGVEAELAAIVWHATRALPDDRYPDGAEFAEDLERWVRTGRTAAPRIGPFDRLSCAARRDPRRLRRLTRRGLGGVAILAALLLLVSVAKFVVDVRNAWQGGDLEALQRARQTADWLVVRMAPALLEPGAISDVAALLPGDAASARLRAAAWIERDGPAAHPDLLRFLAHEVERDPEALQTIARLAFERPARDAESARAYGPLRQPVRDRFASAVSPAESARAASALGGLGDPRAVERLLGEALRRIEDLPAGTGDEPLRTVIEAGAAALRDATARDRTWPERAAWPLLLAVDRQTQPAAELAGVRVAAERLVVEWLLAVRRAGGRPVWPEGIDFETAPWALRAANGGADSLRRFLLEGPEVRGIDHGEPDGLRVIQGWACERYGRAIAMHADGSVVEVAEARLSEAAVEVGLDGGVARELFRRGFAIGRRHLEGHLDEEDPDDDTRLRCLLQPARVSRPDTVGVGSFNDVQLTLAQFASRPFRFHGQPDGLELVDCGFEDDLVAKRAGYLKLAVPGRSAIRMRFVNSGRLPMPVRLFARVQKALRLRLPFGGEASLVVLLDGVPVHESLSASSSTAFRLDVELAARLAPGPHELEIRLASHANTTLRVFLLGVYSR